MSVVSWSGPEAGPPSALVLGCAGPVLGAEEASFFAEVNPLGFILFRRNVENPDQVRALTVALRAAVGRPDAPVLVDQEGGRVARLGPPHWPAFPAAGVFGALWRRDPERALEAVKTNSRLIAAMLRDVGITVDCLPVLDVPRPGAHPVIGDRAYGEDPIAVAQLGLAAADGLLDGGVLPVIKHIPGHGRADVDSHAALPRVDASRDELERHDFAPFKALRYMPLAMTAHVLYTALDDERPATFSDIVVVEYIRDRIGFDGLLLTDDISMSALSGTPAERASLSLEAGCDVVLHCNGDLAEMRAIAAVVPPLGPRSLRRWRNALAVLGQGAVAGFEVDRATAWRDLLLTQG